MDYVSRSNLGYQIKFSIFVYLKIEGIFEKLSFKRAYSKQYGFQIQWRNNLSKKLYNIFYT